MPKKEKQQHLSLFDQIQQMQAKLGTDYNDFTEKDRVDVGLYAQVSKVQDFVTEPKKLDEAGGFNQTAKRLATLAAHYPKNSPELAALRKNVPEIGRLRKEKLDALRADASRSGMDKLRNDFTGTKRRAAREELERLRQARTLIDSRERKNPIKAPERAGKGRNILSPITNYFGMGSHDERHRIIDRFYGKPINFRTKSGMLAGSFDKPANHNGKVVLFFSGSREPAEEAIEAISDSYLNSGTAVVSFNYRGFGESQTLDRNGNRIPTPLSEQSIYEDGMEMYKYVRDVLGYSPENITLHGYSLGGAVASHVAAHVAEQNQLKREKGIEVPDSKKLGGLVMQSPIKSMYSAGKELSHSCIAGFFGSLGSGSFDTKENMRRLYHNDRDIPVAFISGNPQNGDWLSVQATGLHLDPKAPFPNSSASFADCGHLDRNGMLENTTEHIKVAEHGRNAQLDTDSIQRENQPSVQKPAEKGPMEV